MIVAQTTYACTEYIYSCILNQILCIKIKLFSKRYHSARRKINAPQFPPPSILPKGNYSLSHDIKCCWFEELLFVSDTKTSSAHSSLMFVFGDVPLHESSTPGHSWFIVCVWLCARLSITNSQHAHGLFILSMLNCKVWSLW